MTPDDKFCLDLTLGATICVSCGDTLVDGALVATDREAGLEAPWCLDCARELLHARAETRFMLVENG